ncbi:uncharacterized protein LOC118753521 [Rhagoletis pomonella]|uniref:uncharacterized protein LOC118753521 n=1 Tax=Rhagoletis pomonella TaxID=28610 RepID=UPI001785B322|nr:uncharacterized protein LOC118753521 [Rhagoletis pomonella]
MPTDQVNSPDGKENGSASQNGAASEEFFEAIAALQPQQQAAHVDKFERLELPPFWTQQVQLWFIAVEAQFQLRRITADATKYYAVVGRLDQDALIIVEGIITRPPETDKYAALKQVLVNHYSISQERKFKMLLSGLELGDRRPSELLAEINRLGENKLDAAFIRFMWLDRLPPQVQVALAVSNEPDNTKLALLANRLMEVQRDTGNRYVLPVTHAATNESNVSLDQIDKLAKQLEKVAKTLNQAAFADNRAQVKTLSNTSNEPQNLNTNSTPTVCFYHRRFGMRANRCTQPCAFIQSQGNSSKPQ